MPYYLNAVQRDYIIPAGKRVGLGMVGWHTFRHTYRTWMGNNGTPLGIQKDLMRHADIKTTMNVYGGSMPEAMREANSQVVRMAIQPRAVNLRRLREVTNPYSPRLTTDFAAGMIGTVAG